MRERPESVLLIGGSVYSPAVPFATAMVSVDGLVAWLGGDDAAASYADSVDKVVQLEGRLVTPGFVDAHAHLALTGFALQSLDLSLVRSRQELLDQLAAFAAIESASVLFAHSWDETQWNDPTPPTMLEIDRAVGDRLAYVSRIDAHSAVVSSALAARCAGLRDAVGWHPQGVVDRDAHHLVRSVVDGQRSESDRRSALDAALIQAAAVGITSVHELNAPHISPFDDFALLQALAAERPRPEVAAYWGQLCTTGPPEADELLGYAGDLCMDGAIGSRTAAMDEPYSDADTAGHLYLDQDEVCRHVVECTRRGKQAGFHVIGDRALRELAAGFEAAAAEVGDAALVAARHRLEHVEMPDDDIIATIARLGIVASVQPAFDAAWGGPGELYQRRLGAERAGPMNPLGRMHRAGVVLAFGSDSPVTPLAPWAAVRAAAFHHDEHERLTVRAGFNAHTRGGHRARRDDESGVLAPGAAATYAVWDISTDLDVQTPDPRVAAWSTDERAGVPVLPDLHPEVDLPRCVTTVVAGHRVFQTEAA